MTDLMQWTSTQGEKLFSAGAVYISDKKYTIFMPFDIGPDTPACSVLDPNDILIASPKTLADAKQAAQYHYEAVQRSKKTKLNAAPEERLAPKPGSVWQHYNGQRYWVVGLFNEESERQDRYPTTVGYVNVSNGKKYSRLLSDWHRSMTHIHDAQFDVVLGAEKRIVTALKFYADPKNYIDTPSWDGDPECITPKAIPVDRSQDGSPCDCGDIARKALGITS